jgi:hypothetical protein
VAATPQVVARAEAANPIALWHLLSLDAPTVAVVWTAFLARASHVQLPLAPPIAMFLAVWILYASDRLLDARVLEDETRSLHDLEPRHLFHHLHRRAFIAGIVFAFAALAFLLPHLDPTALTLYLIEGAFLIAWALVLHASHSAHRLPKEIAVGLFFAAAVFIPTVARAPQLRHTLLPSALLFAALCILNCLYIYAWEHPGARPHAHWSTRFATAQLTPITLALLVAAVALAMVHRAAPASPPIACALSMACLLALDCTRTHLQPTTLRAAADLALLTPLLFLPLLAA